MNLDVDRLLAGHPLASVLRRCGVEVPDPGPGVRDEWRCHCPLPTHPPPANPTRPKPSFAAHLSGRMAGRWHCFACQTGGDTIELVEAFAQIGFRQAATLLDAGGPIPRGTDPHQHLRPARRNPTGRLAWPATPGSDREPPDPRRTPPERLHTAMAEAWRYYSLDILAAMPRRRLAERDIDLTALEGSERRVLAGHTPESKTGLVDRMHKRGFGDDALVDAGPASRHTDRRSDNLVVVEGALDALAIDACAARVGKDVVAITPSGVALTAEHRASIAIQVANPPVLCADRDSAGRAATAKWVTDMTLDGSEVVAVTLPDDNDPADWLAGHGPAGLAAFVRKGCLDARPGEVRPVHAGRFLAELGAREGRQLGERLTALGSFGARLQSGAGQRRFARQAGAGTSGSRSRPGRVAGAGCCGPHRWCRRSRRG